MLLLKKWLPKFYASQFAWIVPDICLFSNIMDDTDLINHNSQWLNASWYSPCVTREENET